VKRIVKGWVRGHVCFGMSWHESLGDRFSWRLGRRLDGRLSEMFGERMSDRLG
jgi:hypothetical protein